MGAVFSGGCACGQVRYVAEGEPVNVRVCHCRLCQKVIGAAFNARVLFRRDAVQIGGTVSTYATSEVLWRGFCANCGTTVYSERPSGGVIGLTAGSLDDPGLLRPTDHIWTSSMQPWVRLDDGLPQYAEGPPA